MVTNKETITNSVMIMAAEEEGEDITEEAAGDMIVVVDSIILITTEVEEEDMVVVVEDTMITEIGTVEDIRIIEIITQNLICHQQVNLNLYYSGQQLILYIISSFFKFLK